MSTTPKRKPVSRGIVKIEVDKSTLRLSLPTSVSEKYFSVRQKRIALGMSDTPENRKLAQAKADLIQSDITFERFDPTLAKYGIKSKVPAPEPKILTIPQLWEKYKIYKSASVKPKTIAEYNEIARLLQKIDCSNPLKLRESLLITTTNHVAKRCLMQISAAHKWGMQHKLVTSNPFDGMYRDLPQYNYELEPDPNPFSQTEKEKILVDFLNNFYYRHYYSFVRFLFLTGCRPSEAIGLRLSAIAFDYSQIIFDGGIVQAGGKQVRTVGSKNNRKRIFPVNDELKKLLTSQVSDNKLLFPSPEGKPIRYNDFSRRAWNKIVDPIKPDTTPYCCRDTFISEQIAKGVPPAIVAKWVDNSVATIEKYYLKNVSDIVPL